MKRILIATVLVLIATKSYASPSPPLSHVEHESRDNLITTHSWVKRSRLEEHHSLPVRIGLSQSNIANEYGHNLLMDISDPGSANYGRHYSSEEIVDLFAPSQDSIDSVRIWLESSGINSHRISLSANKQWLQFDAKTSELEYLLYTTYHRYENFENGKTSIACDRYHLPKEIQPHVDFIKPGVALFEFSPGQFASKAKRAATPEASRVGHFTPGAPEELNPMPKRKPCYKAVTTECIKKLYNITDKISRVAGNNIGIYESNAVFYSQSTLDKFFKAYASEIPKGTHPVYKAIDGAPPPTTPTQFGAEANLDLEVVYTLVYPDEIVNFQVNDYYYEAAYEAGHKVFRGFYNTFLDAIDGSYCHYSAYGITGDTPGLDPVYPDKHKHGYKHKEQCGVYKPTKVISISYQEAEGSLSLNYQKRQCNEWMKLALQGTTIVFASGDSGVGGGKCRHGSFTPGTPSNCPYVTAVGATGIPTGSKAHPGVEQASNTFGSGGGFSNIYPRPSYQDAAVENYFQHHDPKYKYYKAKNEQRPSHTHGGIYNRLGRGYPDVSAIGERYAGYNHDKPVLFGGTSVSAPLFASIIARINNHRLAAGKGPVGFINPTLYAHPHMFNDVVEGNNPGCHTNGFSCAPGWDPVTGLGTPDYGKMLEVFMKLP